MERLNEIMNRTAQRHQQNADQWPSPEPPQEDRPSSPLARRQHEPLSRPSLPEQTARLGQQHTPASQPQRYNKQNQQHMPSPTRNGQEPWRFQEVEYPQEAPPRQHRYEPAAGRDVSNGHTAYSQHFQQRPPIEERQHIGDYYDAYPSMPQADVQEEWDDDAVGMRYGDWEDEKHDRPMYSQANVERDPSVNNPYLTRELPAVSGRERETRSYSSNSSYSPLTHNLREMQGAPVQLPVPQAPPQEMLHQQRHTQPLNPQTMRRMRQDISQEALRLASRQRESMPQPARATVVRSQSTLYAPTTPIAVCPLCKGAGYLRVDAPFGHPNFGKPIACECKEAEKKEKRRQQLLELSDLSAFQNRSFKNFSTRFPGAHPSVQEALQAAYKFAQNPNGWLVLIGPNGCGKTHLAAAIANQNLSDGAVVLFTVVPDLLAHLRATFAPTAIEAYDQRFSKMREAELLVLDDLGAHQSSPWASEKLFQLLNYRYNSCYPTVITANRQGLVSIDERILSRLSDTALVTTVILNGARDYRRQNPRREPMR